MDNTADEKLTGSEMDVIPSTHSDYEAVKVTEHVSKEMEKIEAINKETISKQNEKIEILSVELVTPRRDQVKTDDTKDKAMNSGSVITCVDIPVVLEEKQSSLNLEVTKNIPNATQNQLANTVKTSDVNVQCAHEGDKTPVEPTANNLQIQPTTITKDTVITLESGIASEEDIPVVIEEQQSPLNLDIEKTDIAIQNQLVNDATLKANTMETSDVDFEHTQVAGKTPLNTSQIQPTTITSGLSLLAEYQSDDDTDSVIEVPITSAQDYRNQVVEINSDSDSDDSDDSSDVECLNELRKNIEKRIEVNDDDEEDDEGNEDNIRQKRNQPKMKVKGEMSLDDLPPIQDLQITVPEDECIELGKIHSIVDQLVLVSVLPNSILLDLETVLFLEKGKKVLGEVFDVLGQVADPLYCVRFNSNKQIKEKEIKVGDVVYVAPKTQFTQYVILSNLMKQKGSDASWENDVEPPPRFLDYSDDEQEQLARRQMRNKDRPIDNEDPNKRPRPMNIEDDTTSNTSNSSNGPQRSRRVEQRNNRGSPANQINANHRPRFDGRNVSQQSTPNNRRSSSWHSNYYPQHFPSQPSNNYGRHPTQNPPPQYSHAYPPHMPVYPLPPPPVHNMSYPLPQPMQYGTPPMMHPMGPQMSNTLNIRPPVLQGPTQISHHHQYTSTSPPPPNNQ